MRTESLYFFSSRSGTSHVPGIPTLCRLFQCFLGWEDAIAWDSEILALKQHIFWCEIYILFYFQHICWTNTLPADTFTTCSVSILRCSQTSSSPPTPQVCIIPLQGTLAADTYTSTPNPTVHFSFPLNHRNVPWQNHLARTKLWSNLHDSAT